MEAKLALGALLMSAAGAVIDVKSARIPNWLTGGALVAGLFVRAWLTSWPGVEAGLVGVAIAGGVLFLPFLARGIGGGDVKLMAAAGAWVGMEHALALITATAIGGGFLAIGYIVFHKRTGATVLRVGQLVRFHLVSGIRPHPDIGMPSADSLRFPYSLAIATGALFVFVSISTSVGG